MASMEGSQLALPNVYYELDRGLYMSASRNRKPVDTGESGGGELKGEEGNPITMIRQAIGDTDAGVKYVALRIRGLAQGSRIFETDFNSFCVSM